MSRKAVKMAKLSNKGMFMYHWLHVPLAFFFSKISLGGKKDKKENCEPEMKQMQLPKVFLSERTWGSIESVIWGKPHLTICAPQAEKVPAGWWDAQTKLTDSCQPIPHIWNTSPSTFRAKIVGITIECHESFYSLHNSWHCSTENSLSHVHWQHDYSMGYIWVWEYMLLITWVTYICTT